MTNTELKSQIDLDVTNKTVNNSVTPTNVGSNIKAVVDYVDQEVSNIALTPGPAGPQGVAGPVGPAGLTWQGLWVSGTSYVEDDAVSYNGASWFCINATSSTTTPNLDPVNWALLAAQGSPGPQGPQGIPGTGGSVNYTEGSLNSNTSTSALLTSQIQYNFTRAYVINAVANYIVLSDTNKTVGDFFIVRNMSALLPIRVNLVDNAKLTNYNNFDTVQQYTIPPKTTVKFTLTNVTGGSDRVFIVEEISKLPLAETLISNGTSAPFPYPSAPYVQLASANSIALPPYPQVGDVYVIFVGFSPCTIWASPDPGNDGTNNNFLNTTGNGNNSMSLTARKCYRFTYVGRFNATFGFWTAEILNTL